MVEKELHDPGLICRATKVLFRRDDRQSLPKGQLWANYSNWKNHLAGFPKKLPADIEIRATFNLAVWVLYVPSSGELVIGPEKAVRDFARKTWK